MHRRRLGIEGSKKFLTLRSTEFFKKVSEFARAKSAELAIGTAQAHRFTGIREWLNRGPVNDPIGMGTYSPTRRAKTTHKGREANISPHQSVAATNARKEQICGTENAHTVDIDHLMVNHVVDEFHFVVTSRKIAKIHLC